MGSQKELVKEAQKWVGITEKEAIDVFRKAVDGKATNEAWCAGFVQYCCVAVSLRTKSEISIPASELCTYIWDHTPRQYRIQKPEVGALIVWRRHRSEKGHIGIIERIDTEELSNRTILHTIEGNTTVDGTPRKGVYRRQRSPRGSLEMSVLGFIRPFK